jgi:hypothetical protein
MSRWVLTAALLLGGVGCHQRADRADEHMESDEDAGLGSQSGRGGASGVGDQSGRAGASGVGGTGGLAGASGVGGTGGLAAGSGTGGQGGRAGSGGTQICSDKQLTREQWCNDPYAHCDLSRDELLAQICRPDPNCANISCPRIITAANGCGGSSLQVSYGVDVAFVIHHFDEHGLLVGGMRRHVLDCRLPQGGNQYTFGEQCALANEKLVSCQDVAADGGT